VQIQRPLKKKIKGNPMNMTTTVRNIGFEKERAGKMFFGTYRLFAHPNLHDNHSRKTPTRKWRQVAKCSLDTYGLSAHGS